MVCPSTPAATQQGAAGSQHCAATDVCNTQLGLHLRIWLRSSLRIQLHLCTSLCARHRTQLRDRHQLCRACERTVGGSMQ